MRLLPFLLALSFFSAQAKQGIRFFSADNPNIAYTGRIDFSDRSKPRFWQPGVYINAKFKGPSCEILVNDEVLWGKSHNYMTIVIDNGKPMRIQTRQPNDTIRLTGLSGKTHLLTICKNTEAGIGYLEFVGLRCKALVPLPPKPLRKIEFFGNSITCGTGSDVSKIPCDGGEWYDQHNAYLSYGPITARALKAQWQLSSVSGIGLIHSCCDMTITMPDVFDKINMRDDKIDWSFSNYQPDVITIALGQNDGIQDSIQFCSAYIAFIKQLRSKYPSSQIVCLTSPMADETLVTVLKNYITGVVQALNNNGDKKVSKYFFSRGFNSGCGGHPDLNEHKVIAEELTDYLQMLMKW